MPPVPLTPIEGLVPTPVGIDFHEPSGCLVLSVNHPTGMPVNFELVAQDGRRSPFTDLSGFTDEVKVAAVRSGPHLGGFAVGEVFTGNGSPGAIVRISPDGTRVENPWVVLDDPGLLRGSLFQDRFGVFGGDLIVVTTTGGVWRVRSDGTPQRLADLGVHLEGVTTVPDLPRYGPWAGRIVIGAEQQGDIHTVARDGTVESFRIGVAPEDIEIIPPRENFVGVDYQQQVLQTAPASAFVDMVGDFLIPQESDGTLWHVRWDAGTASFQTEQVARAGQWEHVAFAPLEIGRGTDMTVDEVFGFVSLRPAQRAAPNRLDTRFARYSPDGTPSPLQRRVESLTGEDRRAQAVELAREFMDGEGYAGVAATPLEQAAVRASAATTTGEAKAVAAEALEVEDLSTYLAGNGAAEVADGLWDSVYAQALAPGDRPDDRSRIYAGARALHYLRRLAAREDDLPPGPAGDLKTVPLTLPHGVVPPSSVPPPPSSELPDDGGVAQALASLRDLHASVVATSAAVDDLLDVDRVIRAEKLRLFPVATLDLASSAQAETEISRETLTRPVLRVPPAFVSPTDDGGDAAEGSAGVEMRSVTVPPAQPWTSTPEGRGRLAERTRELLGTADGNLDEYEPADIVARLQDRAARSTRSFLSSVSPRAVPHVLASKEFGEIAALVPVPFAPLPQSVDPLGTPTPAERGIRPLGVGDLLVVQQRLMRYGAGEVAHIENVLRSENKMRRHTRTQETEETVVVETEEVQETERDLQTTERFELQKETETTAEETIHADAGLSVTASYGVVSATATANFAYDQSRSESNRVATQFAQETVDRSIARIKQRKREERTRRTLERIEEVNEHGLDNRGGTEHVVGVYRWVDKYYRARMVNYGRRLMMEFIVPEPGAFYLHAQTARPPVGVTVTKPLEPTVWGRALRPSDLNASNVGEFLARYRVADAAPHPAPTLRVGAAFAEAPAGTEAKNVNYAKKDESLLIAAEYRVDDVFGQLSFQGYDKYFGSCFIAGESWGSVTAAGLTGKIPITVKGWFAAFHLNVVALCSLRPEARTQWQLDTYDAIMTAYRTALSEYEDQVAAAEIRAGVEIRGRNPEENRRIESDELKKGVLRMLTDEYASTRVDGSWRFDEMFDAMRASGTFGYPEFDVDEALVEGQIIQFFEQAFEWNNVTYRFYPYFWGRKGNWPEALEIDDTDPQFAAFLRAGAARVVVPVHPAYPEAILHYLHTNEIWNGDRPPTLDDPLYVSIVDEIRADTEADPAADLPMADDEDPTYPCIVSEWDIKLPTSLVHLQQDGTLPDLTAP